ncbi:MAG: peptide transporter substrate-binding protein [Deltaproteobacteria bacterium]|jgi:oligopeptide transport system ATP-binding protein|nr:peptide transporter substrate-binding protein [Deltaproteobacteria bacterium]
MSAILDVRNLVKHFPVRRGILGGERRYVRAVDGVSFTVGSQETLGLVGESGCGKSTVGRTILRLLAPTSGEVWFRGRNILALGEEEVRSLRREMQIVFQDPFGALNPRLTVEQIVGEPLKNHGIGNRRERREKVEEALTMVGLLPEHLKRFPHEFSGGQRQRIGIARALVLRPRLVVADEPVSALDVSVQAQVLNLIARLQRELRLSIMLISHDLGVVRHISRRVAVMYLGEIVEVAPAGDLYGNPLHPYTQALLSAVPVPNPRLAKKRIVLAGDVPSPIDPPSGCRFHPRCPRRMEICPVEPPKTRQVALGHLVACHLYDTQGEMWIPPAPGGRESQEPM